MQQPLHMYASIVVCFIIPLSTSSRSCLPCECLDDKVIGGFHAACSKQNLTYVPLTLPNETTTLLMDRNILQWLPNKAFARLNNLKRLDLSRNLLRWLDDYVFYGLSHLESLNLDNNQILSYCDLLFVPKFLSPLANLLELSILGQERECWKIPVKGHNYMYFGNTFPQTLQELYIDCTFCNFSYAFSTLSKLKFLSFSSASVSNKCLMMELTKSTFQYFPYLERLNISNCQVDCLYPGTFLPLKKLRILDMSVYIIDGGSFEAFINATMPLHNSPIEIIKFRNTKNAEVNVNSFMFLRNTSLRELYCDSELYALVSVETFTKLPLTLEVLSFTHFQFMSSEVFDELQHYHSLRTIDMSGLALPDDYAFTLDIIPPKLTTFICDSCKCPTFLGLSNIPSFVPDVPVYRGKAVRKLIVPGNKIEYVNLVVASIYALDYLDLRDNDLKGIYPDFFPPNNTVLSLNLATNRLAIFLEAEYQNLFRRLTNLEFLDISENGISFLPINIFHFLPEIRVLNISNNHLQTVELSLFKLIHLATLDVSNNKLHDLALATTKDIDILPNATIRLSGNPLVCGCEELNFLRWVARNPHRVQDRSSLKCRLTTGHYDSFDNLNRIIRNLEELCKSNVLEISVSVCVAVCAMAILIGFLGYRNRWKLRYLYHVGRRGYRRRYNVNENKENAYYYDAFVSYADEDRRFVIDAMIPELEERCGLKLCIHHRDFLPGEVIAANIVNAIQNSRKTLIILSPAFLRSNWCEFEYNMARMEGVSRRQEIVLVVLYEDVPLQDLPKDMAMMLRRNCYIEYNNDVFDNEVFWYNVLESIKINRPVD